MKTKLAIVITLFTVLVFAISCVEPVTEVCDTNGIGLISNETSQLLANNYNESMQNENINDPDSRSAWFSYKEIKQYLCVLENEYNSLPDSIKKNSPNFGIRVYFGRYPSKQVMASNSELKDIAEKNEIANVERRANNQSEIDYSGKHCIFFVPTYESINKNGVKYNQDFKLSNYTNSKPNNEKILLIGMNKNHGNLAPPESMEGAIYLNPTIAQTTAP